MSMPDNYSRWEQYDQECEDWLERQPRCDHCGIHIQKEHLYDFCGEIVCQECLDDKFKKRTDDYVE